MPQEFPQEWMITNPEAWGLQCALQIFLASKPGFEVLFGTSYMAAKYSREMNAVFPDPPGIGLASFWMRREMS
jgi:hypothetical protein